MNIANFFWYGGLLSCYEWACMASFVQHGFHVRLWCYRPLDVPVGVEVSDASTILPESEISRFTQGGVKGSVTSFSNLFRYTLLAKHGGWWFDSDVLCLKPATSYFLDSDYVFGIETRDLIACGVIKAPAAFASRMCEELILLGEQKGWDFNWGDTGPILLTRIAKQEGVDRHAQPVHVFYPKGPVDALGALDPDQAAVFDEACEQSHAYHFWNEVFRQHAIPKSLMPPIGSFLYSQFVKADPSLASHPSLPIETFRRLCYTPVPVPLHSIKFLTRSLWSLVKRRYLWAVNSEQ